MRERILAVMGALALVALAVLVRGKLVDDGSSGGNGRRKPASEHPVVACTPDLAAICAALVDAGQIAQAPPTLDLDTAANPAKQIEGWITWSPAPEIAELDANDTSVWGKEVVLGSADLGVLAVPSTLGCGQPVKWSCLAEKAGPDLPAGVGAVTTAEGLARIAPLAKSLARNGDATDVDVDRGNAILDGPTAGQNDALPMLRDAVTLGGVDVVVAPLAAAKAAAASAQAQARQLMALSGTPTVRIAVVLTSRGADLEALAAATKIGTPAEALAALGLDPGGSGPSIEPGALWQLRKQLR